LEVQPSAILGQVIGYGFWVIVVVLILRRLLRFSPRGGRRTNAARIPRDFPGFDSPEGSLGKLLPSRLPDGILGTWVGKGVMAQVELSFTGIEYLLVYDALQGVGSGLYEIVDGPDPAFELRLPQSSPETEHMWIRLLPDGRLHVRGEAFEWVLTRSKKDRFKDALRSVKPRNRG
jgi:hypothetical protein